MEEGRAKPRPGSSWSGTALMGEVPNCRHCPSRARGKNVQPGVANIRERNFYNWLTRARDNVDNVRHKVVDVVRAQSGGCGGRLLFLGPGPRGPPPEPKPELALSLLRSRR